MNKKIIGIIVIIIIATLAYFYATPYLVLNSIKNAAQEGDSEKVSAYIDYQSVRQSFKEQVNAQVVKKLATEDSDGWEALGAMIATKMVEQIVDAVVTPEGMTMLLQGKNIKDNLSGNKSIDTSNSVKDKVDYSTRYLSMDMFEITLKNKDNNQDLKIIMKRDGLSWKVIKLVMPLNDAMAQEPQQNELSNTKDNLDSMASPQQVVVTTFDHSGVQPGKIMEFCYRDPCSVAKVTDFQILNKTTKDVDVELTLLGGSQGWYDTVTSWNDETHKVQITCSIEKPTVRMEGQVTVVPLNNGLGVPGVLMTDAEMYLHACHGNFKGSIEEATQKYGYNVQDIE